MLSGFFPARVLRSFVKHPITGKNISIQAIGLSLYEEVAGMTQEALGKEVVRTQWLGPESRILLGRRVLIIVRPHFNLNFILPLTLATG